MIEWELDVQSVKLPNEFEEIRTIMQKWSNSILNAFNGLPQILEDAFSEENIRKHEAEKKPLHIDLTFEEPEGADRIVEIIDEVTIKIKRGEVVF